jgi:hypothetical protein
LLGVSLGEELCGVFRGHARLLPRIAREARGRGRDG